MAAIMHAAQKYMDTQPSFNDAFCVDHPWKRLGLQIGIQPSLGVVNPRYEGGDVTQSIGMAVDTRVLNHWQCIGMISVQWTREMEIWHQSIEIVDASQPAH